MTIPHLLHSPRGGGLGGTRFQTLEFPPLVLSPFPQSLWGRGPWKCGCPLLKVAVAFLLWWTVRSTPDRIFFRAPASSWCFLTAAPLERRVGSSTQSHVSPDPATVSGDEPVSSRGCPHGKFCLEQGWQAAATGQGGLWKAEPGNISCCF